MYPTMHTAHIPQITTPTNQQHISIPSFCDYCLSYFLHHTHAVLSYISFHTYLPTSLFTYNIIVFIHTFTTSDLLHNPLIWKQLSIMILYKPNWSYFMNYMIKITGALATIINEITWFILYSIFWDGVIIWIPSSLYYTLPFHCFNFNNP